MKKMLVNYFFDEDEMELVGKYEFLLNVAIVSATITLLTIIL